MVRKFFASFFLPRWSAIQTLPRFAPNQNGQYDLPVNLGNPDEYTVKHFAEYIKEITQSDSEISFLPATKDDPTQRKPDISTAKRELDWEPKVTVKEGLQQTIAYFSRVLKESGEIIPTGQEASRPKPKVANES